MSLSLALAAPAVRCWRMQSFLIYVRLYKINVHAAEAEQQVLFASALTQQNARPQRNAIETKAMHYQQKTPSSRDDRLSQITDQVRSAMLLRGPKKGAFEGECTKVRNYLHFLHSILGAFLAGVESFEYLCGISREIQGGNVYRIYINTLHYIYYT